MASSNGGKGRYRRRIVWLAIFVAAVVVVYTGIWFYLARTLEREVETQFSALDGAGVHAGCSDPSARGYPFRIGLFCDGLEWRDGSGMTVSAGAFRSAAQVYMPRNVVGELDGPLRIAPTRLGPLQFDWSALHASMRLAEPLPERLSIAARGIAVTADGETGLLEADAAEFHARPNGSDLDLAFSFSGLALGEDILDGTRLPPLDGSADLSIADGIALPASRPEDLRGRSATIRALSLRTGEGAGISLSGPVAVDEEGLVDAELDVKLRDPEAIADLLAQALPQARREIRSAASALSAMGQAPELRLQIVRGEMRMGFVPLGRLPPL